MKSPIYLLALLLTASSGTCLGPPGSASAVATSAAGVHSLLAPDADPPSSFSGQVTIPGPLRSFLRMAGISQKASTEEVLPLLAEVVTVRGYARGRPTEFLILVRRYLQQATELVNLAAPDATIRVSDCEQAKPLLAILGYRLRSPCGPDTAVQTADPDRAFLTIDSGFPLAELEEALRGSKPFVLPFPSASVPVLFAPKDWNAVSGYSQSADLVDSLLLSPGLARLFSAVSRMDNETRVALYKSPGLPKLVHYAGVLDFYGGHLSIRSGKVVVPGGPSAEAAWKDLVGANPDSPGDFVTRLLAKDGGWLAAYFDALSSVSQTQQAYFTEAGRLKRFYEALQGADSSGAARGVFRPDPGLAILATRLQVEANGQPHIPGDFELWKDVFQHDTSSKISRRWARRARRWTNPDELIEGLFAVSRESIDDKPLQIYLTLCDIDRSRVPQDRLSPQTARLLADKFSRFGDQYPIFSEFAGLNNASITSYLTVAQALDRITLPALRANAIGIFQAEIGLWQILARQGEIPVEKWNDSWNHVVSPFSQILSSAQLFDAGRSSTSELMRATTGKSDLVQDDVITLLAGPPQTTAEGRQVRLELARRMQSVMSAQRLVSLETLFTLGEGLTEMAHGKAIGDTLVPLAAELREFEMPRPIFSASEKFEFQYGHSDTSHTTLQTRTNLTNLIKSGSPEDLANARGRLAAFLRDTLVGLNYAYYQPPGAQMLLNNAIFVRSHDYSERSFVEGLQPWKTPELINLGITAAGGTHLAGSLADLPYALALVEQDFIVPEHVQSLIWEDLVPSLLTSAIVPRWWGISQNELHAAALYQRVGEELLTDATRNEELLHKVMSILSDHMSPLRYERIENALRSGELQEVLHQVMPSETFSLAADFQRRFPDQIDGLGASGKELESLIRLHPEETSWERLSRDFGVAHPALAHTYARELMNGRFFPTFRDYSSRLLGESWESNNLYWARLADELGYPAVMLNRLVPELTRRMVEKLFATTLEDWPALSRAMRETGEEFKLGKIASLPKVGADSRP